MTDLEDYYARDLALLRKTRDLEDLRGNYGHVTQQFLDLKTRMAAKAGYPKALWIGFCEVLLENGYEVSLYEAKKTVSKYITVRRGTKTFKVRFSNHKPIEARELAGDCDFFVGRTHTGTRTTEDALKAVHDHFFKGDPNDPL